MPLGLFPLVYWICLTLMPRFSKLSTKKFYWVSSHAINPELQRSGVFSGSPLSSMVWTRTMSQQSEPVSPTATLAEYGNVFFQLQSWTYLFLILLLEDIWKCRKILLLVNIPLLISLEELHSVYLSRKYISLLGLHRWFFHSSMNESFVSRLFPLLSLPWWIFWHEPAYSGLRFTHYTCRC